MEDNRSNYDTGADFWRDTVSRYGKEEAVIICRHYLAMQISSDNPVENKFCQELFVAMYEATADRADPGKLVYPYSFDEANQRMETSYYHDNRKRNNECTQAIDDAVHKSCYKTNYYNLRAAVRAVIAEYGFERVNLVLAYTFQTHDWDGRYSRANKDWAAGFTLPDKAFNSAILNAHPCLIEDFTRYTRDLYGEVGAERFTLPGHAESGERVQGYEINRAITFDDRRGFAIGHDPDAVEPYVCWQFTVAENGKRDYYWGWYAGDEKSVGDNLCARTIVHMSGEAASEILPFEKPLSIADRLAHYKNQAAREQKPAPAHDKNQEAR